MMDEEVEDSWLTAKQHARIEALKEATLLLVGAVGPSDLIRVAWWVLDGQDTYLDRGDAEETE